MLDQMDLLRNIFIALLIQYYNILLSVKSISATADSNNNPRLLLISFDGFRWDYLDLVKQSGRSTPNFDYFVNYGVTIENGGVKNAFMTKTFPNHYSIVTGMYEETHGVVGNSMYDPKYNKSSDLAHGLAEDPFWFNNGTNVSSNAGEPIWITNQKQSTEEYPKQTGVFFWPGSEVEIQGIRPTFYKKFDKTVPFNERVDQVIKWFQKGLINLGLLYFDEPDNAGHMYGPNSTQILDKIVELDGTLGRLKTGLNNLTNSVNIIITSDHGMAEILPKNVVNLTAFLPDTEDYFIVASNVIVNIFPKTSDKTKDIYESLKKHEPLNHFKVYLKQDIPADFHYRFNHRIGSVVAVTDEGWLFTNQALNRERGDHGYNNSLKDMHPIFIAAGPAFIEGKTVRQFNNVDIYPLICRILQLKPSHNDGSLKNIKQVLKSNQITYTMIVVVVLLCIISLVLLIGLYCVCHPKKAKIRKASATEKAEKDGSSEGLLGTNVENSIAEC